MKYEYKLHGDPQKPDPCSKCDSPVETTDYFGHSHLQCRFCSVLEEKEWAEPVTHQSLARMFNALYAGLKSKAKGNG